MIKLNLVKDFAIGAGIGFFAGTGGAILAGPGGAGLMGSMLMFPSAIGAMAHIDAKNTDRASFYGGLSASSIATMILGFGLLGNQFNFPANNAHSVVQPEAHTLALPAGHNPTENKVTLGCEAYALPHV